ncbi:hypothetical protein ACHAWF_003023 [Thalassiosira exigua]
MNNNMSEPTGSEKAPPKSAEPQASTDESTASASPPPSSATGADKDKDAASGRPSAGNDLGSSGASRRGSLEGSRRDSLRQSLRRRSSGLFAAARASFVRNRGRSGASVETLRGTAGADFEGSARVRRGDGGVALFDCTSFLCFRSKRDEAQYVLIKGCHCFVFKDENGKSPKYAIELANRKAVVRPGAPGAACVHLETGLGDVEYELTFADRPDGPSAVQFVAAATAASERASTEQARKRLGHENLLHKRSSVRYAEAIGTAKAKEQPEKPVGAGEVLAGMPAPTSGYAY